MKIKPLLSFIWPQTTKIHSDYNGILELTLINGQKLLDSNNANYSFGSLQKILEIGLQEIELKKVSSILLLGLGGGSAIKSLRDKFGYVDKIYAVELDKCVIEIAKKEFNIQESESLQIYNSDAMDFVKEFNQVTDLIIVDLFIDDRIPYKFLNKEFCSLLSRILSENGSIIFNLGINEIDHEARKNVIDYFNSNFKFTCSLLEKVEKTNTLLIVKTTSNKCLHNADLFVK